jgi:hypothetical protein
VPPRVGHTRPVGTDWKMRLHSWQDAERPPAINDLVWEQPEELKRGFRVVGVEETRSPTTFRVVLERLAWMEFMRLLGFGYPSWCFVRDRR